VSHDVSALFDWLVDGAPGAQTPVEVLERMCPELVERGVPLARVAAFVRTLHPHIMGRSFLWRTGGNVVVKEASHAILSSPEFMKSPVARVFETGAEFRRRLDTLESTEHELLQGLAREKMTDYFALPMRFLSGQIHAITFASDHASGFSDADLATLRHVVRPLTRVGEIFALSRTAVNLLNTYVGHDAGERILAGKILRGDTDVIRCVIWFSDLRGFTRMADQVPPATLIRNLNELFDYQVPAIERHAGEVLKFMGDGMLAIFPVGGRQVAEVAREALAAAREAFESLARGNAGRAERGEPELYFGLALHVGDVTYGNIGGANRLDFTCIGPAVNLAARIEALTSKLGERLLLSAELAEHVTDPLQEKGEHELKGVRDRQRVFALG